MRGSNTTTVRVYLAVRLLEAGYVDYYAASMRTSVMFYKRQNFQNIDSADDIHPDTIRYM
jgi:hypothetical protein